MLRPFHGGLRLPALTTAPLARAIQPCALPPRLWLALPAHTAACVAAGQRVQRGECIGQAQDERGVQVHAPASGLIVHVPMDGSASSQAGALPHHDYERTGSDGGKPAPNRDASYSERAGRTLETVVIQTDSTQAQALRLPALDWQQATPAQLVERIRCAGVVGLGGGAFPTAGKLAHPRRLLILNGAECEPWVACDDALLRERALEVLQGGRVLARATGAVRIVIALESRMNEALVAVRAALASTRDIEVVAVPTIYPQGGERQLIEALTGEQVPAGGLPREIGVLVHNVGTAAAAWRAVAHGDTLISRIVTVTGPGVASPGNYEVAFGTPVAHLIAQAGGYTERAARLLIGGPMMGTSLPDDAIPIDARSSCVLVLGEGEVRQGAPTLPCIRCGDCATACPARLLPQQLHFFLRAGDQEHALEHGLMACLECGCCDAVCPSQLPLAEQFRVGKRQAREQAQAAALAAASRTRHQARTARLAREAEERMTRAAQRKASASSAVQAALERAKARKTSDDA